MQLKEYVLIPMSKNIILPYDNGKFMISKNFSHIFYPGAEVVLGFYKELLEENSILVPFINSNENIDKTTIGSYGTLIRIINVEEQLDDENLEISAYGLKRVLILNGKFIDYKIFVNCKEHPSSMNKEKYKEFNDLRISICDLLQGKDENVDMFKILSMEPLKLFYFATNILSDNNFSVKKQQLEQDDIINGLKFLLQKYFKYNKSFKDQVEQEIYTKFKKNIEDHQKNYLLNEQMKTIKNEIDKLNPNSENNLEEEIKQNPNIPANIKQILLREYEKIRNTNPLSSEYSLTKNYLTLALSLPWNKSTPIINCTLKEAEQIINEEHYGLEDVKENILQYVAAATQTQHQKMKVLVLQGPPGVGKTSIGHILAKCLKREFVFISLVSIESADFFGHRRTYVGAYPGRIINALIEIGVNNPLIFLDEVDKMNKNAYNNPLNILVSLLDPTQNHKFTDQFLSFPFDLSKCIFVLTANSLENIPDYLLSRMEVINIDGYIMNEKLEIVSRFLLPKLYNEFKITNLTFDNKAVEYIIQHYTREMGVRQLQQILSSIINKVIYLNMKDEEEKKSKSKLIKEVNLSNIKTLLPQIPLDFEVDLHPCEAIGMAWTRVGGDILKIQALFINSGKGELIITGNLGQVMKESIQVAFNLLKNSKILEKINMPKEFFSTHSLHVHVPEGATPKDGPSAGITIYTAIMSSVISTVTNKPYRVPLISMTGEISLSMPGEVLAIGGLKQKILAALNYGINEVIVPISNKVHIEKFKNFPMDKVKINYAKYISDVEKIMFKDFIDNSSIDSINIDEDHKIKKEKINMKIKKINIIKGTKAKISKEKVIKKKKDEK